MAAMTHPHQPFNKRVVTLLSACACSSNSIPACAPRLVWRNLLKAGNAVPEIDRHTPTPATHRILCNKPASNVRSGCKPGVNPATVLPQLLHKTMQSYGLHAKEIVHDEASGREDNCIRRISASCMIRSISSLPWPSSPRALFFFYRGLHLMYLFECVLILRTVYTTQFNGASDVHQGAVIVS